MATAQVKRITLIPLFYGFFPSIRAGAAANLFDDRDPDWAPSQHLGNTRTLDRPDPGRYDR